MANPILTIKELSQKYDGEWVLLGDPRVSKRTGEVLAGRVLAHSEDRDIVYDRAVELKPKHSAFLCFQKMPEGTILVL